MNQTEHVGLNQWDPTDRILRADFNADNLKIDAALAAKAGKWELIRPCGSSTHKFSHGSVNIADFNWGNYEYVLYFAEIRGDAPGLATSLTIKTYPSAATIATLPNNDSYALLFHVGHDVTNPIRGFFFSSVPRFFYCGGHTYETIQTLYLEASEDYASGAYSSIYGIR